MTEEATTEPNVYEVMFNTLMEKKRCCTNMMLNTIDGIDVNGYMEVLTIRPPIEEVCVFKVECSWKNETLYKHYCKNASDLEDLCTNILPNLKYHFLDNQLWDKDPPKNIAYDFMKLIPPNDNLTFVINECSVCLEPTTQLTSCGHHLCYKCETKIKNKHCPMCRAKYDHYMGDDE